MIYATKIIFKNCLRNFKVWQDSEQVEMQKKNMYFHFLINIGFIQQ